VQVPTDAWYRPDYNIAGHISTNLSDSNKTAETESNVETAKSGEVSKKEVDFKQWHNKLERFYSESLAKLEPEPLVLEHKGLEHRLQQLENPKHAVQQGSLIGHMERAGILTNFNNVVIEFGCGRGELSRYVNQAQFVSKHEGAARVGDKSRKFLMIDRAGHRMKFDTKLLKDFQELVTDEQRQQEVGAPVVERIKIDIKDIDLVKALEIKFPSLAATDDKTVSAISKHLCGCATDLTLQCLLNNTRPRKDSADDVVDAVKPALQGVVIALCCRQLCNYESYPLAGRAFLAEHGIAASPEEFSTLAKLTSWALCSRRPDADVTSRNHPSGLTLEEREQIGLWARRCIDYGRVHSLREAGMEAKLYKYIAKEVSLENVVLVAK
jgi:tRNA:m4X modification enzyme